MCSLHTGMTTCTCLHMLGLWVNATHIVHLHSALKVRVHSPKLPDLRLDADVVCNMITSALSCILISICYFQLASANFLEGEFVPTARRAQFQGVCTVMPRAQGQFVMTIAPDSQLMLQIRTTWHDLLGRHCPRFGQDRVVSTAAIMQHIEHI